MVELADTQDLGSCVARRAGSTPVTRTKRKSVHESGRIFVCIIHHSLFIKRERIFK